MIKSYSIVSVYVRKENKPTLDEMMIYAKANGVSLNELIWKCIDNSWTSLKAKKTATAKV